MIRNYILRSPWRKAVARILLSRVPLLARFTRRRADTPKSYVRRIVRSGLLDADHYGREVGVAFKSAREAAEHYLAKGEGENKQPSKRFDPRFYRKYYQDASKSPGPLLLHFYESAPKKERRFGSVSLDPLVQAGHRQHRGDWPTVLLCAHEASVTGAPILAYNIARHLSSSHNVIIVLVRDGALLEDFADYATKVVLLNRLPRELMRNSAVCESVVRSIHRESPLHAVIANSAVCEPLAAGASEVGLAVVTLVHEFAEYVGATEMRSVLKSSHVAVFSSELTAQSARDGRAAGDLRNLRILPQGRCDIPASRAAKGVERQSIELDSLYEHRNRGRLLVVGCGAVQIRKGVDLFVSAAQRVAAVLGEENVKFVWIGDGYKPTRDFAYSIWLEDQIKRSGLERVVSIIPAVSSEALENVYSVADAMFVSSRLDPLPNVAIDAMHAGLPVVCFDRATGVAEYLRRVPGGEKLVAPYLDVAAAAAAIMDLANDRTARARLGEHLNSLAAHSFDMPRYIDRLLEYVSEARDVRNQEEADLATLRGMDELGGGAFLQSTKRGVGQDHRIQDYVELGRFLGAGGGYRRPLSGFSPQIYVEHNRETQASPFPNPLAHWLRSGRPAGPWARKVLHLDRSDLTQSKPLKIGLHLHLHYPELVGDILRRLEVNDTRCDLLVSCNTEDAKAQLESQLRTFQRGTCLVRVVPNRGRDVGPMITEFGQLLSTYDLIGHIHGKKSLDLDNSKIGDSWREFLWQNLLGDKVAALDRICAAFAADDRLGLIFPEEPSIVGWNENREIAALIAPRVGVAGQLPDGIEFPVGNMFIARPAALEPLLASGLTWEDYPEEPLGYDGTILHALERLTPLICENQGYHWLTTTVDGVTRRAA